MEEKGPLPAQQGARSALETIAAAQALFPTQPAQGVRMLNTLPHDDHRTYSDEIARAFMSLPETNPAYYARHFGELHTRILDHWRPGFWRLLDSRVPDIIHPPETDFHEATLEGKTVFMDEQMPVFSDRMHQGVVGILDLVFNAARKRLGDSLAEQNMGHMDFGYLFSGRFPKMAAFRRSARPDTVLTRPQAHELAEELMTFCNEKIHRIQQGSKREVNAFIQSKRLPTEAELVADMSEQLTIAKGLGAYYETRDFLNTLTLFSAIGNSVQGLVFERRLDLSHIRSCFWDTEERRGGSQEKFLIPYYKNPHVRTYTLSMYKGLGTPRFDTFSIVQNLCFEAVCGGEKVLVHDGALSNEVLGFANDERPDFRPHTQMVFYKNLEGLVKMARSEGYRKLLINASHSTSHRSTHDFTTYACRMVGMPVKEYRNGRLRQIGPLLQRYDPDSRMWTMRLSESGLPVVEGFPYTHHLHRIADETPETKPCELIFYSEAFHPWNKHQGYPDPRVSAGNGFIRAIGIDLERSKI